MNISQVLEIGRDTLYTTLLLSMPALLVSLLVGLAVSVFQTVTSVQDQTLGFVPRILAVGLVLLLTLAWSIEMAVQFFVRMIGVMAEVSH